MRGRSYEIRKTHKDITIIVCHQGSRKRTNKGQVQLGVHAFLEFLLVGDSADLGLHQGVPHVGEERNTAVLPVQGLSHIRVIFSLVVLLPPLLIVGPSICPQLTQIHSHKLT